jgi:hypothetical protein
VHRVGAYLSTAPRQGFGYFDNADS